MEMQERCRNVLMSSRGLPDGNGWECGRHHVHYYMKNMEGSVDAIMWIIT